MRIMTASSYRIALLILLSSLLLQSCSSIRQSPAAFAPPKLLRRTSSSDVKSNKVSKQQTFVSDSLVVVAEQQPASFVQHHSNPPLYQLALAGALATMLGDAAMHPMDCIKTLQQSDEGVLLSVSQAANQLWEDHGIGGFYRGLTTYLITDSSAGAVKFGVYEGLKQWTKRTFNNDDNEQHSSSSNTVFLCAGIAFIASSVILVPGELLKQQLQMGHYSSLTQAASSVFETSGIAGLFTGYQGVCLRDVPYTMMELGLYDLLKTAYLKTRNENDNENEEPLTIQEQVLCAAITGGVAGFLTTPLDTVKTKLMVDHYTSVMTCYQATLADGSLFSGAAARVAWLMPFSALYLPLFDTLKRKLGELNQEHHHLLLLDNKAQEGPTGGGGGS